VVEILEVGAVAADEAVDLIVFGKEEVGEVCAILACDSGD
jgi:hypothetical protein